MDISAKYLGDDMVLLLGLNDARAENLLHEDFHGMPPLFYSIQKWMPNLRPGYRLAWVQCWAIPVIVWDAISIKKIVGVLGDLVEINDDIDERWQLDRGRALVKTPWKPAIQHIVEVHIGAEVYEVRILEERGGNVDRYQWRRSSVVPSSEEIDSDGSYMGSPTSEETKPSEIEDMGRRQE